MELGQIFPSSTTVDPFGLTISSIWTSSDVPNLPGLFTQECKWSIIRVDNSVPVQRKCNDEKEDDVSRCHIISVD